MAPAVVAAIVVIAVHVILVIVVIVVISVVVVVAVKNQHDIYRYNFVGEFIFCGSKDCGIIKL